MLLGFGPQDWDLGLKAGIWASRLRYGPGGGGAGRRRRRRRRRRKEFEDFLDPIRKLFENTKYDYLSRHLDVGSEAKMSRNFVKH